MCLISISFLTCKHAKVKSVVSGLRTRWWIRWVTEVQSFLSSSVWCTVPLKPWRSAWWTGWFLRRSFSALPLKPWASGCSFQVPAFFTLTFTDNKTLQTISLFYSRVKKCMKTINSTCLHTHIFIFKKNGLKCQNWLAPLLKITTDPNI